MPDNLKPIYRMVIHKTSTNEDRVITTLTELKNAIKNDGYDREFLAELIFPFDYVNWKLNGEVLTAAQAVLPENARVS